MLSSINIVEHCSLFIVKALSHICCSLEDKIMKSQLPDCYRYTTRPAQFAPLEVFSLQTSCSKQCPACSICSNKIYQQKAKLICFENI